MKSDILEPGHYRVRVTREMAIQVTEPITEEKLMWDTAQTGAVVDWEVEEE